MGYNSKDDKIKLWSVAVALIIWQIVAMIIDQQILIVSPLRVIVKLYELVQTTEFWSAVGISALRIIGGFLAGLVCAVALAIPASRISFIRDLLAPFMITVRSIPVASFVILALIWFSSQNLAILISFLMVLPIIYTNVLEGIRQTDTDLLEMATVFKIKWSKKLRYIYFFQVYPFLVSAIKISLGLSWKSGVAAEVIGTPENSIGENLFSAKIFLDTASLLAWTVVIVLVSTLFEKLFMIALKRIHSAMERCS